MRPRVTTRSRIRAYECPGRDSNPYSPLDEGGFKPPVSASSTTRAMAAPYRPLRRSQVRPSLSGDTAGCRRGGVVWRLDDATRGPELGAEAIGSRRCEPVGDDDPFDHVGEHGGPGSTADTDRDGRPIGSAADGAVDADEPGRAPEARADQTVPARLGGEGAGSGGEVGGRGHTPIMNEGCHNVRE